MQFISLIIILLLPSIVWAQEWRGFVAAEYRLFTESALDGDQHDGYASIVLQPEFYFSWDDGRQALVLTPFYRWDQFDEQRRHGDLRELFWLYVGSRIEWRVGIRRVFWGVTESQHLVDIINQTDLVENPAGEEKLGQPMLSASLITNSGVMGAFIMPYFRERTFPGEEGRLRSIPRVETEEDALYEDRLRERHLDWAIRWAQTLGSWDIGLSHFYGTSREPKLVSGINGDGENVLLPYYELINQTGLDVQATLRNWLWKLEAIRRESREEVYGAATVGFEYTFYGIFDSPLDAGLVLEYLYDTRHEQAPTAFEDDLMLGLRLTPNDAKSSEILFGAIIDRHSSARAYNVEASRRVTDHLKWNLEARFFAGAESGDPLYSLRNDDYVQLQLVYYF